MPRDQNRRPSFDMRVARKSMKLRTTCDQLWVSQKTYRTKFRDPRSGRHDPI
jgi:hypothetical protein